MTGATIISISQCLVLVSWWWYWNRNCLDVQCPLFKQLTEI